MLRSIWLRLATVAAVLSFASVAYGEPVPMTKSFDSTARISGLALTSARWTGWMSVGDRRTVSLGIDFTDANSSCTAISLVCETAQLATTTADAGRDLHMLECAGGVCDSAPLCYCYGTDAACTAACPVTGGAMGGPNAAPGTKSWTWLIGNIPDQYLNCKITASGTPAAADVVTVYSTRITP